MGGTAAVIGILITTLSVPYLTKTGYTSFFVLGSILVPLSLICITFITSKKILNNN
jgi:ACS family hexuronate transporter-like MFS transporter